MVLDLKSIELSNLDNGRRGIKAQRGSSYEERSHVKKEPDLHFLPGRLT